MYDHEEGLLNPLSLVWICGFVFRVEEVKHVHKVFAGRYRLRVVRTLLLAFGIVLDKLPVPSQRGTCIS